MSYEHLNLNSGQILGRRANMSNQGTTDDPLGPSSEATDPHSHIICHMTTDGYRALTIAEVATINTDEIDCIVGMLVDQLQQGEAKRIAKEWVRAFEPRKQHKYPYNGGDRKEEAIRIFGMDDPGALTKPPWWPKKGCRHKDPDHMKKAG